MNFKKLICMICLGTAISGLSAFAMEQKCDKDKKPVEIVKAYNNKKKIYDEKRTSGKSQEYAEYYAFLIENRKISEDTARELAEVYEKELKDGKDKVYADYYAIFCTCVWKGEKNKGIARRNADILYEKYNEELEAGRDKYYAKYYANLTHPKTLSISSLWVGLGRIVDDELEKRKMAELYSEKRREGKEDFYADCYAYSIVKDKVTKEFAELKSDIYSRLRNSKMSGDFEAYVMSYNNGLISFDSYSDAERISNYYTELVMNRKIDRRIADRQTEIFFSKHVEESKSYDYSDFYASAKVRNDPKAEEKAALYEHYKGGNDRIYWTYYVNLIVDNKMDAFKASMLATIYEAERRNGKSHAYADYYAKAVLKFTIKKYRK